MSAARITGGGGELKAYTIVAKPGTDAFWGYLEWWEVIVQKAPADTKAFMLSTIDLSQLNKILMARVRIPDPVAMKRFNYLCKLAEDAHLMCSPAMGRGCVVALVEE